MIRNRKSIRTMRTISAPIFGAPTLSDEDKFEPLSGGGTMNHAEEAIGQPVVADDGAAIDFEMAKRALVPVTLLIEGSGHARSLRDSLTGQR